MQTIQEQGKKIADFEKRISQLNDEVIKKSMKLGDIFNLVMNQGTQELFCQVTDIMGAN
jgi:hypothetical protein